MINYSHAQSFVRMLILILILVLDPTLRPVQLRSWTIRRSKTSVQDRQGGLTGTGRSDHARDRLSDHTRLPALASTPRPRATNILVEISLRLLAVLGNVLRLSIIEGSWHCASYPRTFVIGSEEVLQQCLPRKT